MVLEDGPDPRINLLWLKAADSEASTINKLAETAFRYFSSEKTRLQVGDSIQKIEQVYELSLTDEGSKAFEVSIEPGRYVLFTEHKPEEFSLTICTTDGTIDPLSFVNYDAGHTHDREVTSVGIDTDGDLDQKKFNNWLATLLREKGKDIFRMKGILSIAGEPERFVFQGVHMLFDGRPDRPWGNEKRSNQLIFIGRNLNRKELLEGFNSCLKNRQLSLR